MGHDVMRTGWHVVVTSLSIFLFLFILLWLIVLQSNTIDLQGYKFEIQISMVVVSVIAAVLLVKSRGFGG